MKNFDTIITCDLFGWAPEKRTLSLFMPKRRSEFRFLERCGEHQIPKGNVELIIYGNPVGSKSLRCTST
ncbi:unnamed protein product [Angiostrongylus costaricensis]|uniref:MSP domain-containing protein n=1 Tax=Angiostrongylus costaricensis TaxID=334426 RepID=A0A0R3PX62_ANGCS|nr:unnamed protein product [Angiostrongylus costaricensis]